MDQYNLTVENYSFFGDGHGSFKAPEGMGKREAKNYLGGSSEFRVTDIEVYEVDFLT